MAKWVCKVCGYVYEGDAAPEQCPICKVPASQFEKVEEERTSKYAGTKTEKNLMEAFAGESQARNKYTYFAEMARKEGLEQIAAIFEETANQEKEHAKRLMKLLNAELKGEALHVEGDFPIMLGTTAECLKAAAAGENEEWTDMYPEFAKIADEEG